MERANHKSLFAQSVSPIKTFYSMVSSNRYSKLGFYLFLAYLVLTFVGPLIAPYAPLSTRGPMGQAPSSSHLLGTTIYGQDVFSQVLVGAGPTLGVGIAVGFLATLISVFVGVVAGLKDGSWLASVLVFLTYIFLLVPGILVVILFGAFFLGAGMALSYVMIIAALSLTGWAWGARTLRSQALVESKRDHILSSKLIGESTLSIVTRQIIRNNFSLILSNFFFTTIYGLTGLTFVEFFGLGSETAVNWGTMLYWVQAAAAYITGEWWWYVPVSVLLAGLAFSFALMNFGLDQIANPTLSGKTLRKLTKPKSSQPSLSGTDGR